MPIPSPANKTSYEAEILRLDALVVTLQSQIALKDSEISNLQSEITVKDTTITGLQLDVVELGETNAALVNESVIKDTLIADLREDLALAETDAAVGDAVIDGCRVFLTALEEAGLINRGIE